MTEDHIKNTIEIAIKAFSSGTLSANALNLFNTLGYITERQAPLADPTFVTFSDTYINDKKFDLKKANIDEWNYVDLLFQLSKEEVLKQTSLFDTKQVDQTIIETYLFFCIELEKSQYSRTDLSLITREVNRLFPMPVMILFKYGHKLTLSVINRRLHKRDSTKDVLEKVTLIKDISIENPHRAHIEILYDLSFEKLKHETEFTNFVELHNSWQKTLNIKLLNNRFYKDIASWFYWACKNVEFPDDDPYYSDREIRNSENIIRLLTRIIFCWFMKEKGLIKPELFNEKNMEKLLVKDSDKTGSTYYKAILQNLFFATLNIPVKKRRFITDKTFQGKNTQYFDHSVFRYKRFFKPNASYLSFFKDIPFLNGGLFECQDYMIQNENGKEVVFRIDCFSDHPKNEERLKVPDEIFFGKERKENWLNNIFGTKNQDYSVSGIFSILSDYKFTIEENTPLEEEIALDPDLLGIVFENLLASYNPETRETARKQTGSFYTPREIVNYMVEESLIASLKNKVGKIKEDVLRELITSTETIPELSMQDKNNLIEAIDNIKILDPACGSGAFPMGILQKLVHLLHKLDPENNLWRTSILHRTPIEIRNETEQILKTKSADYIRKLGLIQNCIYGVDIQPIAVEISKLRFFLALLVDFDKTDNPDENWGIEPLPNLDFKIMQGDSLVEEFNGVSLSLRPNENKGIITFINSDLQQKIEDLHESQGLFLRETHPVKKKALKDKVNNTLIDILHYHLKEIRATYFNELTKIEDTVQRLGSAEQAQKYYGIEKAKIDKKYGFNYQKFEIELKDFIGGKKPRKFFPFSLFFVDVFENGGFDIVIGNPPWVSQKGVEDNPNISYAERNYYRLNYEIFKGIKASGGTKINLFGVWSEKGLKLLKIDGQFTMIVHKNILKVASYKTLRKLILDKFTVKEIVDMKSSAFSGITAEAIIIRITTKQKEEKLKIKILTAEKDISNFDFTIYNQDSFYSNHDFIFNIYEVPFLKKLQISNDFILLKEIIDIVAFGLDTVDNKKYFTDEQLNKEYKPAVMGRHISKWVPKSHGYVYYNPQVLAREGSPEIFESKEKIIMQRISSNLVAAYDSNKLYCFNSTNILVNPKLDYKIKFILALLNSSFLNFYYRKTFSLDADFTVNVTIGYLSNLIVPKVSKDIQLKFSNLVDFILLLKVSNCDTALFERIINTMVYELYLSEAILSSGNDIIKHIDNIPILKDEWSKEKKLSAIENVLQELSDPKHPINVAMFRIDTIEEIRIIEGK